MGSDESANDAEKRKEAVAEISRATSDEAATTVDSGDGQRTLWENVKKYRKVVYVTLGLTSPILLYGYDNVIVGTVSGMPGFQYE